MTTPDTFSPSPDEIARGIRLNTWLDDFYHIFDPDLTELRFALQASWNRYVESHLHSLLSDFTFRPETRIKRREEDMVTDIRVCTTSDKKWGIVAPLLTQSGFNPIRDVPSDDEETIHRQLRTLSNFTNRYAINVARGKQKWDLLETPAFTLDTVVFVEGELLEKPKNIWAAINTIAGASGKWVTTDTGWVLGMQVQSGASVELINATSVTYKLKQITPEAIAEYIATTPTVLNVSAGIDLSTQAMRNQFIDMTEPVTFRGENNLNHTGKLIFRGDDLKSSLFDSIFAGVPVHAIKALLPLVNDIYLHGDPVNEKALIL